MNAGGNDGACFFDSIADLRFDEGGVNHETGFAFTGAAIIECRKNDNDDDGDGNGDGNRDGNGDGGFRNPNTRATILGDGALVTFLLEGACGGLYNLAATSAGLFSTTRDHRMDSRGRTQMQKRNK